MAQFTCGVCGDEFEQKSRYERHLKTSHPKQAPSAADVQRLLAGIEFPGDRQALVRHARENGGEEEAIELLEQLPDQEFRDAAEVTRALGAMKSEEEKPTHQPGKRGGQRSAKASSPPSAARVVRALAGVSLPKSAGELKKYAVEHASEEIREVLRQLPDGTYEDMSDIAAALGEIGTSQ